MDAVQGMSILSGSLSVPSVFYVLHRVDQRLPIVLTSVCTMDINFYLLNQYTEIKVYKAVQVELVVI